MSKVSQLTPEPCAQVAATAGRDLCKRGKIVAQSLHRGPELFIASFESITKLIYLFANWRCSSMKTISKDICGSRRSNFDNRDCPVYPGICPEHLL